MSGSGDLALRHPTEADYPRVVELIDEWWGGRRMRHLLPRLWFRHFASTCWLAEVTDRPGGPRLAGYVVGAMSGDDPSIALLHLLAVDPNRRREGIGRLLVERFVATARAAGARRIEALVRPDERPAVAFAGAVGFEPVADPPAHPIHGVPGFDDWDGPGEDRTLLVLRVAPA